MEFILLGRYEFIGNEGGRYIFIFAQWHMDVAHRVVAAVGPVQAAGQGLQTFRSLELAYQSRSDLRCSARCYRVRQSGALQSGAYVCCNVFAQIVHVGGTVDGASNNFGQGIGLSGAHASLSHQLRLSQCAGQLGSGCLHACYTVHHRAGVVVVNVVGAAGGNTEGATLEVVAELYADTGEFAVISVSGDTHTHGETADNDIVICWSLIEEIMILYIAPVVGSEETVQLKFAVIRIGGIYAGKGLAVHGHVGFQLPIEPYSWSYLGVGVYTEAESRGIVMVMLGIFENIVIRWHSAGAEIIQERGILEYLIFQFIYPYAQSIQFAGIIRGQLVQCSFLVSRQGVFLSHEAGYNLSHFITGNIFISFKGFIRIAVNDAFVSQLADSLI